MLSSLVSQTLTVLLFLYNSTRLILRKMQLLLHEVGTASDASQISHNNFQLPRIPKLALLMVTVGAIS